MSRKSTLTRGIVLAASVLIVGSAVAACTPPLPPDVLAAQAENSITCQQGDQSVSVPEAFAGSMMQVSSILQGVCAEQSLSESMPGAPATLAVTDQAPTAEDLAREGDVFDAVLLLEVVEHEHDARVGEAHRQQLIEWPIQILLHAERLRHALRRHERTELGIDTDGLESSPRRRDAPTSPVAAEINEHAAVLESAVIAVPSDSTHRLRICPSIARTWLFFALNDTRRQFLRQPARKPNLWFPH